MSERSSNDGGRTSGAGVEGSANDAGAPVLSQIHVSCYVTAANRAAPVFEVVPEQRCVRYSHQVRRHTLSTFSLRSRYLHYEQHGMASTPMLLCGVYIQRKNTGCCLAKALEEEALGHKLKWP
ncbi:hypothetical protein JG688_00000288 [Phytophthora aleatoria]|uniref:Uncharacterized protein n=1 Tax=Phytophthora aleatoria TaxID=2496075 RepID=A0A8J5J6J1_9STRA|nr:hypothetical protein JG688_00000288 [Phytophthora aleatoria]